MHFRVCTKLHVGLICCKPDKLVQIGGTPIQILSRLEWNASLQLLFGYFGIKLWESVDTEFVKIKNLHGLEEKKC